MLAFIEGTVVDKQIDYLILRKGALGFRLNFDKAYAGRMPGVGSTQMLWTYLHVREAELSLYAFPSYEEKQLFELLLTVSGIGPKLAGAIAAGLSPTAFALAIMQEDLKQLTSIPGVGKKGAQRMILELRDKMKARTLAAETEALEHAVTSEEEDSLQVQALEALEVLGYKQAEGKAALRKAMEDFPSTGDLPELIRLALRALAVQ